MQIKKWIATGLSALMAGSTLAAAALAASPLSNYPTFFGGNVPYVVVGASAATSDVVGAVDIMASLAVVSTTEKTIPSGTTTAYTGIERKVAIPTTSSGSVIGGSGTNQLPDPLKNYHFSGLLQGQYSFKGTAHNYHEEVDEGAVTPMLTHSLVSYVNGTMKMKVDTGAVTYKYVFDDAVSGTDFNATAASTTTYQTPVTVKVAGKDFLIVAIPSTTSFIALTGTVAWVQAGSDTGITVGGLTALVDAVYTNTQAAIRVVDANGNLVQNLGVVGTDSKSFTYGGDTYKIKILNTATSSKESVADSAQVVFGKGDVEKTYDNSDTAYLSDWTTDWKISGVFNTAGIIKANDYITVTYSPTTLEEANKYYAAGSKFQGPGQYFELNYAGLTPNQFAKITVQPVTGKTVYNSTVTTGYSTVSGLNGLEIASDVAGTLVSGGQGYDKMYVLFNASGSAGTFNDTFAWLAYFDKTTSRVVNLDTATYPQKIQIVNGSYQNFTITLSYGGPGATAQYSLYGIFDKTTLIGDFIVKSGSTTNVDMAYVNRTLASTSAVPELVLGGTVSKAEGNDVTSLVEGTLSDVALQYGDILTDNGLQVYSVKGNGDGDKVIVGVPPETIYGLVQFGKIGATSTTGGTYSEFTPITSAVAKLDTELATDADRSAKNLVLVGGPCVNQLVRDLATAGKIAYTCDNWPGRDFGLIQSVDDAFATGKVAVVVAGTRAADTRLASSVLQQYATQLATQSGQVVEVTGTTAVPVITPV